MLDKYFPFSDNNILVNVFIGVVKLSKVTSRNVRIHPKLNACYSVRKSLNAFEICEILM